MENYVIILILAGISAIAVHSAMKYFRGQGSCCGGGDYKPERKKLSKILYKKTFKAGGMSSTESRREREKRIVSLMIRLYCNKKHGTHEELCPDCRALRDYAMLRSDKCPFMETKTFCSNCRVHCYKTEMREKIRVVMRFSGPRMMMYHPVMAVRHVMESNREKKSCKRAGYPDCKKSHGFSDGA